MSVNELKVTPEETLKEINQNHFEEWAKLSYGGIGLVPGYSQGLMTERLCFDYIAKIKDDEIASLKAQHSLEVQKLQDDIKKADTRLEFIAKHMNQPALLLIEKLVNQIDALKKAITYYANPESWTTDSDGHESYQFKIKDDEYSNAGLLRWVRMVGGRRAKESLEQFDAIEFKYNADHEALINKKMEL